MLQILHFFLQILLLYIYFHDFLDEEGKSEKFNKFLGEGKKSGAQVTSYIKDSFKDKASKKRD